MCFLVLYLLLVCWVNKSADISLLNNLLAQTKYYPQYWQSDEERPRHENVLKQLKEKPHFLYALHGQLEQLREYCKKKSLIVSQEKFEDGSHLLHFATCANHLETIKWLVDEKVDLNKPNTKGHVPLFFIFAQKSPSLKILEYMIEKGAQLQTPMTLYSLTDLPEKVLDGFTRLNNTTSAQWAAHFGWHDAIELLILHNISFTRKDELFCLSPLTLAAINLDYTTMYALLSKGVMPKKFNHFQGHNNFTIYTWRIDNRDRLMMPCIKTLVLFGSKKKHPSKYHLYLGCPEVFTTDCNLFIKQNSCINIRDQLGISPFMYACGQGATKALGQLRKQGANVFNKNNFGSRTIDIVKIIIKRDTWISDRENNYHSIYNYLRYYYRFKNSVLALFNLHPIAHKSLIPLSYVAGKKMPLLPNDIIKQINYYIEH